MCRNVFTYSGVHLNLSVYMVILCILVHSHQCALVRINAVWCVCCGHQRPVVFVPAVGGRRDAEFVLTVKLQS